MHNPYGQNHGHCSVATMWQIMYTGYTQDPKYPLFCGGGNFRGVIKTWNRIKWKTKRIFRYTKFFNTNVFNGVRFESQQNLHFKLEILFNIWTSRMLTILRFSKDSLKVKPFVIWDLRPGPTALADSKRIQNIKNSCCLSKNAVSVVYSCIRISYVLLIKHPYTGISSAKKMLNCIKPVERMNFLPFTMSICNIYEL